MNITINSVVSFHYSMSENAPEDDPKDEGNLVENCHLGEPTLYLHGAGNIIPGLEKALTGKVAGDEIKVSIPPLEAYGPRRDGLIERVSMKRLTAEDGSKKLRADMRVQMMTDDGPRQVIVIKPGRHSADVDTNHPLAGKTLHFDIKIVDVRAATDDEVTHGHAHGPGGHHH
ncbi:MAG: FKBP-type peptidyl-prolyl cis-trans isomerase SlyD [Halioglobus sp.]|jgi:FKBP-type peptidyl-prolyl cis-trans isomerase SlyD